MFPHNSGKVVERMTAPLSYFGSSDPLPSRRTLRAGPLLAIYEAGDLRYLKVGGVEVCRRWYAAVRDHNWGTVPGVISDEVIEETAAGFRVTYTSTHQQGGIHFVWRAAIIATADLAGSSPGDSTHVYVEFRFDGEARSTFRRNRIGFCVLHPPNCAGMPVWIHHSDGTMAKNLNFPELISPDNPFRDVTTIQPQSSHQAWWKFEGEVFETEDQRNWIDASFKTFCTPLSRPFPVEVQAGVRVMQTVTMSVASSAVASDAPLELVRHDQPRTRLPAIGLSLPAGVAASSDNELLRQIRPAHLRVELILTRPGFCERLKSATEEANAIGTRLELAVNLSDKAWEETKSLIELLQSINPPLARVLALHHAEWTTPGCIIAPVVEAVSRYDANVPVFVGTRANFSELNRRRPDLSLVDGVCYSVHPQEHAFDNSSLIESCSVIADTVRTARSFSGDKLISVGPITLRKRVNPYATGPDWQPPPPDPRQGSLFGAAWTLGALKHLAESGVASATFYETVGPRGTISHGRAFPLFHVLADANEWPQAAVVKCVSTDPLRVDALVLQHELRTRVLLANMTAEPQTVSLDQLSARVGLRTLDEMTFDFAASDPVAFRQQVGETRSTDNGRLSLSLKPHAYVCIDG